MNGSALERDFIAIPENTRIFIKRLIDIAASAGALAVLGLPLILVGLLIRWNMGGPALFRQIRPGLDGKPFTMIKFRTMRDASSADGMPLPDAERLTPLGRFLRASSIDELPELWNVLRGDMSLVGPRPLLMEYLPLYSPEQARRHLVRPGLTGWAQVNGRNAISWSEKFKLDVWYVDNRSLAVDLKIIALTIRKIIIKEGISAQGEATMTRFMGELKVSKLIGIYGASGFGREVLPTVRRSLAGEGARLVFIDDGSSAASANGYPVFDWDGFVNQPEGDKAVVIAIANSRVRAAIERKVKASGIGFLDVCADNNVLYDEVEIGAGVILQPFVTITSNARIGRQFHANIYSYVAHDCVIGDYVTFAPAVRCNGNVHIEDHAYIGSGAILKQGTPDKPLVIGHGATVGMGAVVTRNVAPGETVVGNPARPMVRA